MKLAFLAPWFVLLFGACTMARPEGAFDGTDPPDPDAADEPDADDDDDDDVEPIVDARVIPRPEASGPRPTSDAGQTPSRVDGEVKPPVSGDPREALAGRYLMRMDMYSSLDTAGTPRIQLRNRVSNLFLVDVVFDGERLQAREALCDQTYAHRCQSGCRGWSTKIDSAVRAEYFGGARTIEREYGYDEASGKLTAKQSAISLGYDEREGQSAVPTDASDPRVWKKGGGPGLYTIFEATPSIGGTITCQVSTVQRFTTEFSGTMSGTPSSLDGKEFSFTTMTMGGVIGEPTGSSRTQCTRERFEMQPNPQNEKFVVRFKAYSGDACPSTFDSEFKPVPEFM
jgi:hypothetical protein